jgi:hypothetical protein
VNDDVAKLYRDVVRFLDNAYAGPANRRAMAKLLKLYQAAKAEGRAESSCRCSGDK